MGYFTGYETMKYGKKFYDNLACAEKIIVYGAGNICRQCFSLFKEEIKEKIMGIAVTSMDNNEASIEGIEVRAIDTFLNHVDATIVIAIKDEKIISRVQGLLKSRNFNRILTVDCERLKFYKILDRIQRSKMYLCAEKPDDLPEQTELYEKILNIGKFLSCDNLGNALCLKFHTLSLIWGGSSLLDYSLLRGLVLKYQIDTYLEIGTYIGDSLTVVSDLVKRCYSISVPEEHPAHMKNWCEIRHTIDYSNKLVTSDNMFQYLEDSKEFDFKKIKDNIGLYFIDGDHSYEGVLIDSLKVFEHFDPDNNFIVWHDCRTGAGTINLEIVGAIQEAAGEYFKNFFLFDNSMCGIYIPNRYTKDFIKATLSDRLATYEVVLTKNGIEL